MSPRLNLESLASWLREAQAALDEALGVLEPTEEDELFKQVNQAHLLTRKARIDVLDRIDMAKRKKRKQKPEAEPESPMVGGGA